MKLIFIYFCFLGILFSGNLEKKIIYHGWGIRDTIYISEHWEEMEKMPFDGIGIKVAIDRKKPTIGDGVAGNILGWNLFGPKKFSFENFKDAIEDLKSVKWKKFKDNFLSCAIASKGQDYGLNWFDDERWEIIYNNWEIFIKIAKEGNLKGIFIDLEHYDYDCELFCYKHHKEKRIDKPFSEYKDIAFKRGRDLMKITKKIFPDITIFLYNGYSTYLTDKILSKKPEEEIRYSLLSSFLDGMLAESDEKMKFVEINSKSPVYGWQSSYIERIQFLESYFTVLNQCRGITKFPEIYRKRISVGFGLSFDYPHGKPFNTEDFSKNYFTPEKFYNVLKNALEISDEYVWIYTGNPSMYTGKRDYFLISQYPEEYIKVIEEARNLFKNEKGK